MQASSTGKLSNAVPYDTLAGKLGTWSSLNYCKVRKKEARDQASVWKTEEEERGVEREEGKKRGNIFSSKNNKRRSKIKKKKKKDTILRI